MHHHGQDCLRLKVDVAGHKDAAKTHQEKPKNGKKEKEDEGKFIGSGGVHNPANRLSAGETPSERGAVELLPAGSRDTQPPFSFLRRPCCDGAQAAEEYRKFRQLPAGFPPARLRRDPRLVRLGASLSRELLVGRD